MLSITTFYVFLNLEESALAEHKSYLLSKMIEADIKGTIILAQEGLNATLCGEQDALAAYVDKIKQVFACDFEQTLSTTPVMAFGKSKVRIKPTLIKLGVALPRDAATGHYIEPEDWNAFISRDDVILIDARNSYETYLGTFKGARDPHTRKFTQLPDALEIDPSAKIATFCTGGIRCEKYTAWLKTQGYDEVYHLKGGILRYLAQTPQQESMWEGSCYVFDDRVAVTHALQPDESVAACPACGHSLQAMDLRSDQYVPGKQCRHCATFEPSNAPVQQLEKNPPKLH